MPKESYHIRLGLNQESLPMTLEPMVKSGTANDLYAVQVSRKMRLESSTSSKYAYGLFDNTADMVLELETGYFYDFEVTYIPNGKNLIARDTEEGFRAPFLVKQGSSTSNQPLSNEFIRALAYFERLNTGTASIEEEGGAVAYDRPKLSRFYGQLTGFEPTADATVSIDLKWVSFGLSIELENFTAREFRFEMEGAPPIIITPEDPDRVTEWIYTFFNPNGGDWSADAYSEAIPVEITWIKSDGSQEKIYQTTDEPITFKRRYLHTLSRDLDETVAPTPGQPGLDITCEDPTFAGSEEILPR